MKQFFNYHSKISSLELSQAFATIAAPGPFLGFASAAWSSSSTSGYQLKVYSGPQSDSTEARVVNQYLDQIYRRYIAKRYNQSSGKPAFGCITKDGTIYTSDETQFTISIQGTPNSSFNEVFLFAVHSPVSEDVENPVTFVAYWNSSSNAIYPLYKKSVDPYYQQSGSTITDPNLDSDLTFQTLDGKVKAACTSYANNYDSYTLIGVYGSGKNLDTNTIESFDLVTYFSQFPMALNYNTAIHTALAKSMDVIASLHQRLLGEIGEIHMFAGSNIPDGYLVCDGTDYYQSQYPELYAVIGNQYNTALTHTGSYYTTDSNKFRVPDLRARFIVGKDTEYSDYNSLGKGGGKDYVTLLATHLPTHNHSVDMLFFAEHHNSLSKQGKADGFYGLYNGTLTKGRQGNVTGGTENGYPGLGGTSDMDNDTLPYVTIKSGDQGANQSHENRPPFYTLLYIIRAKI